MNLKKLTNEELLKSYERLCKRYQKTKEDIEYKKGKRGTFKKIWLLMNRVRKVLCNLVNYRLPHQSIFLGF